VAVDPALQRLSAGREGCPELTKADNGVWELAVGPLGPGAYRYDVNVLGVAAIDPRNPPISDSNNNVRSLVHVPAPEVSDTKDVPRGGVLGERRRGLGRRHWTRPGSSS
jgi:hypothetical protein